ncbi:hypothetical protein [Paenibacillus ottowii]|uniref:hypothetical protein n=1 Tax=Paenibacillus ottowii TaxID=2315729 RepID=UPI003D2F4E87
MSILTYTTKNSPYSIVRSEYAYAAQVHKCEHGLLEVKADFGFGLVDLALIAVKVMRGINPD